MKPYSLKDVLPLTITILLIIGATLIVSYLTHTWDTEIIKTRFMGLFFLVFGTFKVINLKGFVHAYSMYDIVAQRSMLYAYFYPFIELGLGIAYLMRWHLPIIAIITIVIMSISAVGVARALGQGRHITCACLGTVFKIPMTYVTLNEDIFMAVMALDILLE